jgi:enediyne biosynthesis protein E4
MRYAEPIFFYHNVGGKRFEDVSSLAGAVFGERLVARGCAFGDFDNNGTWDVLINPINDRPRLLRCNRVSGNNWITLKLIGTKSNRSAIGARVRCVTGNHQQIQEVRSGGSHFSQNDLRIHFGLGGAARIAQLEIAWPSGQVDHIKDLPANQIMTLREGLRG